MQTIKKGLVAAFFAGLTGCVSSLKDFKRNELPSEELTIRVDAAYLTENWFGFFTTADVSMNARGYSIECDENYYFKCDRNNCILRWNSQYLDRGMDGYLDEVLVDPYQLQSGDFLGGQHFEFEESERDEYNYFQEDYNSKLKDIKQPQIHRMWLERWHLEKRR